MCMGIVADFIVMGYVAGQKRTCVRLDLRLQPSPVAERRLLQYDAERNLDPDAELF